MSCGIGPGSSHHAACDCREAEFALNLREAEARAERLEKAARDMCREWRLHGQLTDSCRPMERVLGIHAPFCPTWGHKDCECDLRAALLPPPEPAGGEVPRG